MLLRVCVGLVSGVGMLDKRDSAAATAAPKSESAKTVSMWSPSCGILKEICHWPDPDDRLPVYEMNTVGSIAVRPMLWSFWLITSTRLVSNRSCRCGHAARLMQLRERCFLQIVWDVCVVSCQSSEDHVKSQEDAKSETNVRHTDEEDPLNCCPSSLIISAAFLFFTVLVRRPSGTLRDQTPLAPRSSSQGVAALYSSLKRV